MLVVRCHIVLDQIAIALDLADQVCLVAYLVEIAMADLPVVISPYGVVALANVHRDMHFIRQVID